MFDVRTVKLCRLTVIALGKAKRMRDIFVARTSFNFLLRWILASKILQTRLICPWYISHIIYKVRTPLRTKTFDATFCCWFITEIFEHLSCGAEVTHAKVDFEPSSLFVNWLPSTSSYKVCSMIALEANEYQYQISQNDPIPSLAETWSLKRPWRSSESSSHSSSSTHHHGGDPWSIQEWHVLDRGKRLRDIRSDRRPAKMPA